MNKVDNFLSPNVKNTMKTVSTRDYLYGTSYFILDVNA